MFIEARLVTAVRSQAIVVRKTRWCPRRGEFRVGRRRRKGQSPQGDLGVRTPGFVEVMEA